MNEKELEQELYEALRLVERYKLSADIYAAERNHARACYDISVKILIGIHSCMYPAPIKMKDGRTMVFRPKDPNPHEVLQELSDRIRAIPDEIAAIYPANAEPSREW